MKNAIMRPKNFNMPKSENLFKSKWIIINGQKISIIFFNLEKNLRFIDRDYAMALMTEWEPRKREEKFGTFLNNCHLTINRNYV